MHLLSDPNGYSYVPHQLNPDASNTTEALETTRLQPMDWRQRHFQDASIVEWFTDNQASPQEQREGLVKIPIPRAALDQPFTFKFDKSLKDARIAAARVNGPGAVASARDDIAVVNFLEGHTKILHKSFMRHLYMYDCAQKDQAQLQYEIRETIAALAQRISDKDEATQLLTQLLGGDPSPAAHGRTIQRRTN